MWELRNSDGPRKMKMNKSIELQRCPICGQVMKPDDPLYIVVCNCIPACTSRNMHNQMPHTDCWDEFCKGITDDEILAEKLKKHRKPKMKG